MSRYRADIDAVLGHLRVDAEARPDFEQEVWIRLFVGVAPKRPKIFEYAGRGSLRAWVRTVALRIALNERSRRREATLDDTLLRTLAAADQDLEAAYFDQIYGKEFRLAFARAFEDLDVRARNLLNQHFVDRLTVDQLAILYRVHRATAARQVVRARNELMAGTRRMLMGRLRVGVVTADSIINLLKTHADMGELLDLGGN